MTRTLALLAMLALAPACGSEQPVSAETRAREAWLRDLVQREGLVPEWSLTSRSDLQFEDGMSTLEMTDPSVPFKGWAEIAHGCASQPAMPVRWMGARIHLRVRGTGDMKLEIRGRVDIHQLFTSPMVTASFDGEEFHAGVVDADGYFLIAATIPHSWLLHGWSDIYVALSSIHEPWRDPGGLLTASIAVARLEGVTWEPVSVPTAALDPIPRDSRSLIDRAGP